MEHRQFFAPPSQTWLPPAAAARHVEQQLTQGAKQISFHTIDPSAGPQPIEMKIAVAGRTEVEVADGRRVPAIAWQVETSQIPGMTMTEYVDEQGRALRTDIAAMPGMTITLVAAERQTAMGATAQGPSVAAQIPVDVMANTFVVPDRPVPNVRQLRQAVYALRFEPTESDGPITTPDVVRGGYQRVAWSDERTVVAVIDLDDPVNPGDDLPTDDHRRSSLTLNYRVPQVMKLLSEALAGGTRRLPATQRAEHLRRFVHDFIDSKDLATGFATAAEVARTAQGDCTEHAVLLAALLRGSGIPSRTVTGLLYVEQFLDRRDVFGYHMWTQAWLADGPRGGRWVDLDATLAHAPFTAGHIALTVSAQDEATALNDMARILPWLGRLAITVLQPEAE
jgi:transglutaminase-like putative cysteine protease